MATLFTCSDAAEYTEAGRAGEASPGAQYEGDQTGKGEGQYFAPGEHKHHRAVLQQAHPSQAVAECAA